MSSEWRRARIGDLAEVVGGGTPSTKVPEYFDGEIPWMSPKDLSGDHPRYVSRGARNISRLGLSNSSARTLPAGAVLLSTRAPVGYVAIAANELTTNQGFRSLLCGDDLVPEYMYYWLTANTAELERHASGTTFRELSGGSLKNIELPVPSVREQQAIASILGALDDKIELNREMSRTLDAVALALYRSWFVEATGHAWLGDGGAVPDGWRVSRLGDEVEATRGLSYSSKNLVEEGAGLPLHNLNTVKEGGGYKYAGIKWFDGQYKERNTVVPGDLVVTNVEQGFEFLLIGFGALVPRSSGPLSLFSADLFRVRPLSTSGLTSVYLYQLLREPRFHRVIAGYSNGTTVNHLSSDAFSMPRILIPPGPLVKRYTEAATPMMLRMESLHDESLLLRQTRDALLPRLLSGELRITDAEKVVEEVM